MVSNLVILAFNLSFLNNQTDLMQLAWGDQRVLRFPGVPICSDNQYSSNRHYLRKNHSPHVY